MLHPRPGYMRRQAWALFNEAPETLIPRLLAEGHSVYGIAQQLGVATNSIRHYVERNGYTFDHSRAVWTQEGVV